MKPVRSLTSAGVRIGVANRVHLPRVVIHVHRFPDVLQRVFVVLVGAVHWSVHLQEVGLIHADSMVHALSLPTSQYPRLGIIAIMDVLPIPGYPRYFVSADGRIWSQARGPLRELVPGIALVGRYQRAQIRLGRGPTYKVAALICLTFHGPRPSEQHEVAHLNGDSLDNHAANLAWKTHAENEADKIRHGRTNRGTRQWQAKLTDQDVREIRRLAGTMRQADIAARFGIKQPTVSEIISRKKWAWLD